MGLLYLYVTRSREPTLVSVVKYGVRTVVVSDKPSTSLAWDNILIRAYYCSVLSKFLFERLVATRSALCTFAHGS